MTKLKVVALISGGKDSIYNIMQCMKHGHDVVALANLYPIESETETGTDFDLDSMMYQTVGNHLIPTIASECLDLPLFRSTTSGKAHDLSLDYLTAHAEKEKDEVEDLYRLLLSVKEAYPEVNAVSSGAILSTYQKLRVEHVCDRLGMVSLAYLWNRNQPELLKDMIKDGMESILIKTASFGMKREMLGKTIGQNYNTLISLGEKYGAQVCGEGGEFETLTLCCPIYKRRILVDEQALYSKEEGVHYMKILAFHTEANPGFTRL